MPYDEWLAGGGGEHGVGEWKRRGIQGTLGPYDEWLAGSGGLAAILLCLGRIIFEMDARRCVLAPLIFNAGGLRFAMGAFS